MIMLQGTVWMLMVLLLKH